MSSQIPEKLAGFRLYGGPKLDQFLGITDVELPTFEALAETIAGAGIAGEYNSPTRGHFKALEMTFKVRTATEQVLSMPVAEAQRFEVRAAEQAQDAASAGLVTRAFRVETKGPILSIKPGKVEPGKPMDCEVKQSLSVCRIFIDGKSIVELDLFNFVYKVQGVDYLAAQRVAMGG